MSMSTVKRLPLVYPAFIAIGLAVLLTACGGGVGENASPTPAASPTPEATGSPSAHGTPGPSPAGTGTPAPGATATPSPTPKPPVVTEARMVLDEFVIKPDRTRAPPGTVVFKVKNNGKLTHQFVVIKSDLPIAELPRAKEGGVDEKKVEIVGRLDAVPPGGDQLLSLELGAGKYVLICNIVSGGTSHYVSGMYNAFTVQEQ